MLLCNDLVSGRVSSFIDYRHRTHVLIHILLCNNLFLIKKYVCLYMHVILYQMVLFLLENTRSMYLRKGEARPGVEAAGNQVAAAISSSFLVLIGIFFPSVTGKRRLYLQDLRPLSLSLFPLPSLSFLRYNGWFQQIW